MSESCYAISLLSQRLSSTELFYDCGVADVVATAVTLMIAPKAIYHNRKSDLKRAYFNGKGTRVLSIHITILLHYNVITRAHIISIPPL